MDQKHYLIHFTSLQNNQHKKSDEQSLNILISILHTGLLFSENEVSDALEKNGELATKMNPEMICFADITREYYHEQRAHYGNFGICIDKNFIRQHGGQPVIYNDQNNKDSINNRILNNLREATGYFSSDKKFRFSKKDKKIISSYYLFQAMTQPIKDQDENEWRTLNIETFDLVEKNLPPKTDPKYLLINDDNNVCFIIIPSEYKKKLINGLQQPDKFKNKIIFTENFANSLYQNSLFKIYNSD